MASGKLQNVLQQAEEGGRKVGLSLLQQMFSNLKLQPEAWGPDLVIVMVATNNSKYYNSNSVQLLQQAGEGHGGLGKCCNKHLYILVVDKS